MRHSQTLPQAFQLARNRRNPGTDALVLQQQVKRQRAKSKELKVIRIQSTSRTKRLSSFNCFPNKNRTNRQKRGVDYPLAKLFREAYSRGATFERKVKLEWERDGWLGIRSAGSHGKIDLIFLRKGDKPVLVQCKSKGQKRAGALDLAALDLPDCRKLVAVRVLRGKTEYAEVP